MKRKLMVTFLIAILTMMMSFVFATDVLTYDTMLISETPDLLIAPNPNSNKIKVQLDGEFVDFTDAEGNVVNPKIIQNRTMVPMRKIFEIFNAEVNWNNETRTVVATTIEKEITLTINSDIAKIKDLATNEEKEITLDSAPVLVDNRTMVPVRFIAESLEKEVGWDAEQKTVVIIDLEKLANELEEKAPALKKLFELELEPINSFKTTSEIAGKIVYKDAEEKSKNETIEVTGDLNINMNQEKEFEMYLDLAFDGKGTIYNSIVEAGYEKMKFALVMANSHVYMMMEQNGEEIWMDLGSQVDISALEKIDITTASPKNYNEFVDLLKTTLGELNSNSYMTMKQSLLIIEWLFGEDCLEVTTKGNKSTVKMELDLKEILLQNMNLKEGLDADSSAALEDIEFKISLVQKIEDKKVEKAEMKMEIAFAEPTTEESLMINFELDMEYTNVNQDFEVMLPEVEALKAE